jgi:hypothetical protein
MTISLNVFNEVVDDLIEADDELLTAAAREQFIKAALAKYSGDRPDSYSEDVTGDAGKYYAISNLTYWSEGFSHVTDIEYPAAAVASDETPVYLSTDDWRDDYWAEVSTVLTRHIWLPNHAPAATETMRVTYSIPYTFDATTTATSAPAQDFYAICYWAAGLCCQAMAAKFAKSKDSLIAVDSATHSPKSTDYAARAVEFFNLYNQHMGIGTEGAETLNAAGEFVDWDTSPEWPAGRSYIFRGGR